MLIALIVVSSVADPDPYFFGPLGSGSINQRHGRILLSSNKNNKKNLDSYCFVTSFLLCIFKK